LNSELVHELKTFQPLSLANDR